MTESFDCEQIREALAEVATGAATGPDRDRVARHLVDCDMCRRELEELSRVSDELLLAAPEHEPPARFESTVLERIAAEGAGEGRGSSRWSRRSRLLVAAAAAVGVAGVSAGIALWATSSERELAANYRETLELADGQYFAAAPLTAADDSQVGHVFLYEGSPSWLFVVLDPAPGPGPYDIAVTVDGVERPAGRCVVTGNTCSAGDTVDGRIGDISSVRLDGPDGAQVAADLSDR